MRIRLVNTIAVGLCLTGVAAIAQKGVVPPEQASGNVSRLLSEIPWQTSLATAEARARRENKLVFWVQMRGKIDGYS